MIRTERRIPRYTSRFVSLIVVGTLAATSCMALAAAAGAQTGDIAAFCAARLDGNGTETKSEVLTVLDAAVRVAPADALASITALRDGVAKNGIDFFASEDGLAASTRVDAYLYDNCSFSAIPITAIDYAFQGVPATLVPRTVKLKLTNAAPREMHEIALLKLNAEGQRLDPEKLLRVPQRKAQKYVELAASAFAFAPPGQSGYAFANVTPGRYLYACFIPVGGRKNGKPHFTKGMWGTLTVQ